MATVPVAAGPPQLSTRDRWAQWARSLVVPWYNALLTACCLAVLLPGGWAVGVWAVRWARWDVVGANLRLFAVGTYPPAQAWRPLVALVLSVALAGFTGWALRLRQRRALWVAVALWLAWPAAVLGLVAAVRTSLWGGLLVTVLLSAGGIVLSFPLGVLLALGRRSRLGLVRVVCTAYIELVRGVPLVSVLFMAQLLLPLFVPGMRPDKLLRALVGITAFTAAYIAENVRGGLQGVPLGQYEAAYALGLSPAQALALVVLPQALRAVLPSIAGQFISLLKDTSLVAIMGILDLLGVARSVLAHPRWLGRQAEVYLFVGAVYWLLTYSLSRASRRLERPELHGRVE